VVQAAEAAGTNLMRRHLTEAQKATIAVEAIPLYEVKARERQRGGQGGILLTENFRGASEAAASKGKDDAQTCCRKARMTFTKIFAKVGPPNQPPKPLVPIRDTSITQSVLNLPCPLSTNSCARAGYSVAGTTAKTGGYDETSKRASPRAGKRWRWWYRLRDFGWDGLPPTCPLVTP